MAAYIAAEGLDFGMASPARYQDAMRSAGFVEVSTTSRNAWYREAAKLELERLRGPVGAAAAGVVGQEFVDENIGIWTRMIPALESGEHCPTHLRAHKPRQLYKDDGSFIMKAIGPGDRKVANIHEAEFTPFVFAEGKALGDSILQLNPDEPFGNGFHVYRMPAGMTTCGHRHVGPEHFLVLEGELVDSDGKVFRAGDLVYYRDGTEHHSYTPNGCTLAVHITAPEVSLD